MQTDEEIRYRLLAKEEAESAFQLLDSTVFASDDAERVFWERLTEKVLAKMPTVLKPKVVQSNAMDDQEASVFERSEIPFGEWKGQKVYDTPIEYLVWLDEQTFHRQLNRYLRSKRGQRRQPDV